MKWKENYTINTNGIVLIVAEKVLSQKKILSPVVQLAMVLELLAGMSG
ncbi:MAG TPA: hypothetical protein VLB82_05790 [Thermodesulfobacteriota bacterium]|nr:hypothetical protein [Thermodesulfobacteriota bacterium]